MQRIVWDNALSTGNKLIDADHKRLIEMINNLIDEIEDSTTSPENINTIFDEIEAYTIYHFEREESLMHAECLSYKDADEIEHHQQQHQKFVSAIPMLKEKLLRATEKETAIGVVDFLAHWLLEHIIVEDLTLRQCFTKDKQSNNIIDLLVRKLSLSSRSLLIVVIPFILLVGVSLLYSLNIFRDYQKLHSEYEISHVNTCVNTLSNVLQRERGLSQAFLSSNQSKFKEELVLQRQKTSEVISSCHKNFDFVAKYHNINMEEYFSRLQQIRSGIDARGVDASVFITQYTEIIEEIILMVKKSNTIDGRIGRLTEPLIILLSLKENYGLLRMEGAMLLQQPDKSLANYKEFLVLNKAYSNAFELIAPEKFIYRLKQINNSENSQKLMRMQNEIVNHTERSIKAEVWFEMMSLKIENYAQLIDKMVSQMRENAERSMQEAYEALVVLWSLLVVMFILSLLISITLKKSILKPIEAFTASMQSLANGDKQFFINPYNKDDAIGKMIAAFDSFRRSLIQADYASILLDIKEKKVENYETLANLDPLTKALNRRGFIKYLERAHTNAQLKQTPLLLLAIDLDYFKKINDTYGHDVGDLVLQRFVTKVQEMIRHEDSFARTGGEEFSLLLPSTTKVLALRIAHRILEETKMIDFSDISTDLHLSASIGISQYREGCSIALLQKEADEQLYKAKENGRDQVVSS